MHKIALLNNFGFLAHSNGRISTEMPMELRNEFVPRLLELEESCIWTLCGVEKVEYTFHIPRHLSGKSMDLHPFPRMIGMQICSKTQMTITGDNFVEIDIYFGSFKSPKVIHKTKYHLVVDIPLSLSLMGGEFPILFMKSNGIIYRSGFHVKY